MAWSSSTATTIFPAALPGTVPGVFAAGGLALALATGHGPAALTNRRGLGPYVPEQAVVVLGYYPDPADAEYYTVNRRADSRLTFIEHTQVRQMGAGPAAQAGVEHLSANGLDQFWIDLDADVLDPALMPVVDAPNLVGLSYAELTEALGVFLASGRAAGLEVTIFDPDLDHTGEIAAAFVDALVEAFQGAKPWRRWVAPSGPWVFLGDRPRIFAGNHPRGVQLNAPTRQFVVILDPLSA